MHSGRKIPFDIGDSLYLDQLNPVRVGPEEVMKELRLDMPTTFGLVSQEIHILTLCFAASDYMYPIAPAHHSFFVLLLPSIEVGIQIIHLS